MSEENKEQSRALVNINSGLSKTQTYFELISELEGQIVSSKNNTSIALNSDWKEFLQEEFDKAYFNELVEFVKKEYISQPLQIQPKGSEIFKAFETCKLNELKVVIVNSEPFPTRCNTTGLAFSVEADVSPLPKAISNIFNEITNDTGIDTSNRNGDLTHWAKQGVLLLNDVLTCREGKPGAHQNKGWEQFTSAVLDKLNKRKNGIVFILWGSKAQKKISAIESENNLILHAPHPSPLSAYRGFFGCKHFSKTNEYLEQLGKDPIRW